MADATHDAARYKGLRREFLLSKNLQSARVFPELEPGQMDDDLLAFATECEVASASAEQRCISTAIDLVMRGSHKWLHQLGNTERAARLAATGACESAVLSLIPESASITGGRLANGTVVTQVVLSSAIGAHSRKAQTLAMAWLAAYLRALSHEECRQITQEGDA